MNEQLYQTLFVLGPPYPGPPPRAPHLPLDNTKVHPSDINMVYKKPNAVNENTNSGVRDSQLPFAQDYPTDRNDLNLNTHHDKSTPKPATIVSQQPPTIIVVQQPAPQPYMPNPYYGNGYQVISNDINECKNYHFFLSHNPIDICFF